MPEINLGNIIRCFTAFAVAIILSACKDFDKKIHRFNELFPENRSDTICTTDYNNDALRTFISPEFYDVFDFPRELTIYEKNINNWQVKAIEKILLKDNTAYIISFAIKDLLVPRYTCLYIGTSKSKQIDLHLVLSYVYGSEGSTYNTQSWLTDFIDGKATVFTRIYECNVVPPDAKIQHYRDTLTIHKWSDLQFVDYIPNNYHKLFEQFKINTGECY